MPGSRRAWRTALGDWSAGRARLAVLALVVALTTATLLAVADSGSAFGSRGALYVGATALALFLPAGIAAQVVLGQILIASILIGGEGIGALLLVPAMAGVVVTAELLAVVARLDSPVRREAEGAMRGAGSAAALGGGVFGIVALAGAIPGPSGLLAVVLASGACVLLAARLVGGIDEPGDRQL